jgi:hypothetical protein
MPSLRDNSELPSLVLISFDCDPNSRVLLSILASQGLELVVGGVGVQISAVRFNSTAYRSNRTRPAPQKLPLIFPSVINALNASWKAGRKVILSTCRILLRTKPIITRPYLCFRGKKQPTSSGYRI